MRNPNDKEQVNAEAAKLREIKDALKKLKTAPGYGEYIQTLKDLYKDILARFYNVNFTDPSRVPQGIYYQAQLDLIKRICSITYDVVLNEMTDEQTDEPAA